MLISLLAGVVIVVGGVSGGMYDISTGVGGGAGGVGYVCDIDCRCVAVIGGVVGDGAPGLCWCC